MTEGTTRKLINKCRCGRYTKYQGEIESDTQVHHHWVCGRCGAGYVRWIRAR